MSELKLRPPKEQCCKEVARPERFELPTLCFEGRCSIQLSYGRAVCAPDESAGAQYPHLTTLAGRSGEIRRLRNAQGWCTLG